MPWWNGTGKYITPRMVKKFVARFKISGDWLAHNNGDMEPTVILTAQQSEVLAIMESLTKNKDALDSWLKQGRTLVELVAPKSNNNPFGSVRR